MGEHVEGYKFRDIKKIFKTNISRDTLLKDEKELRIPKSHRVATGKSTIKQRVWDYNGVSIIGQKYGFLSKPTKPTCLSVFSTKGGVLKSTIALNIARMYSLHNVKTCVIDLDPQGDTSRNLGFEIQEDSVAKLSDLDEYYSTIKNLNDLYMNKSELQDIIQDSEIPNMKVILSSSELIPLMDRLNSEVRREYWLRDNVISKLYEMGFEMVIIDLAPSWNIYTSNAITCSDILVSPLECRIAHYRNIKEFINQLDRFSKKMRLGDLKRMFVPTKISHHRKISVQIRDHYIENIEGCTKSSIRESIVGEEAVANRLSFIESSNKVVSEDIREFLLELNDVINPEEKLRAEQTVELNVVN